MNQKNFIDRLDEEWTQVSQKWLKIHQQLVDLEQEEKALRDELIQMSNNQNTKGGGITLTRTVRKGTVQYNLIPELKNIDLEKFRKEPAEVWRLVAT